MVNQQGHYFVRLDDGGFQLVAVQFIGVVVVLVELVGRQVAEVIFDETGGRTAIVARCSGLVELSVVLGHPDVRVKWGRSISPLIELVEDDVLKGRQMWRATWAVEGYLVVDNVGRSHLVHLLVSAEGDVVEGAEKKLVRHIGKGDGQNKLAV